MYIIGIIIVAGKLGKKNEFIIDSRDLNKDCI